MNYVYHQLKRLEETSDFTIIKGHFRFNNIGIPQEYEKYYLPSINNTYTGIHNSPPTDNNGSSKIIIH